ncbi:13336_t:CDS:2, partial [Dentiscutata erythropus]
FDNPHWRAQKLVGEILDLFWVDKEELCLLGALEKNVEPMYLSENDLLNNVNDKIGFKIILTKHGEIRLSYKKENSFLYYIEGGLEIQLSKLSIAIDFTAIKLYILVEISRAIDIYKYSLQNVNLSGPTNFSPIDDYDVISDLTNTIEAIMNTIYPLSSMFLVLS